ncbi:MAG: glycosyltransferase family 4 protein [Bacteroidales bacterium]|nr:glycosyltransferase family 4 protein [Bacteroidales bacterium]
MKILMLNNEYPPFGGGTGIVNQEIIERLKNHSEFQIDLLTGNLDKHDSFLQLSPNVRIIRLGLNRKNIHHASHFELIRYALKAFIKANKLHRTENYDFSFGWSTIPAGVVSYLLFKLYKLPYLIRIGGTDIPGYEARYKTIYKIITPLIKRIWKRADLLISKCIREKGMVAAINPYLKIKIIGNGIDPEQFKPISKVKNKQLTLICPARLIKLKSQDLLIKAVARLKEKGIFLNLNLVGYGDEMENYTRLAQQLGVTKQVNYTGYVKRDQMITEYNRADILVMPSQNEGMSNALIEGMACGLPVLVSDVGGTEELVTNGENGYIFPVGDFEKLCNLLLEMVKSPERLKEMGEKSREIVIKLNWDNILYEYKTIFHNSFNNIKKQANL